MLSSDLKVVCLNITEDFYDYKGTFQLCSDNKSIDLEFTELTDQKLKEIKADFGLEESIGEINDAIMAKVFEAANVESRDTR